VPKILANKGLILIKTFFKEISFFTEFFLKKLSMNNDFKTYEFLEVILNDMP